jgi:hypothetical protein
MATSDGQHILRRMLREPTADPKAISDDGRAVTAGFAAANLLVPRTVNCQPDETFIRLYQPRFLSPPSFYRFPWKELIGEFLTFYPLHLKNISVEVFREIPVLPRRFAARPLAVSLIFHLLAIPLLTTFLQLLPTQQRNQDHSQFRQNSVVYYHVQKLGNVPRMPQLSPFGPGSSPGSGSQPEQTPAKAAPQNLASLFAISRPHIPDNTRQTILQPNMPPELKIKNDLKLPNLVARQSQPAKPRIQYAANDVRPLQPKSVATHVEAPKLSSVAAPESMSLATLTVAQSRIAVPIGAAAAPIISTGHGATDLTDAPSFSSVNIDGANPSSLPITQSRVGVPLGGASAPVTSNARGQGTQLESAPTFDGAGMGASLTLLSVEPGPAAEAASLPPGSRLGQFAIAPVVSGQGSPGGKGELTTSGGVGGNGSGGNESSGVGRGTSGGGGGNASSSGFISLRGGNASDAVLADPGPGAIAQMVYALPESALLRRNTLVVSAGPIGGGGSNVYGALPCGKIYTVFLPTGSKPWSLQFCQKIANLLPAENRAQTTVVHTELPLIPPEAKKSYDFERLPLSAEKAHKFIILKGAISEDGTVEELEIHQGLLPTLDAAARLAFSQWKFKPAMRSGKPVRVEILVAIPSDSPNAR